MNSTENSTASASAVLDCSASAVRSADPVITECLCPLTWDCVICGNDKPPTEYDGYTFRCPCGAVNEDRDDKRICDKCVVANLQYRTECPTCRTPNYAKKIRISYSNYGAIDLSFSFLCPYEPIGAIDPSFSYTEQRRFKYDYLKPVLRLLGEKNMEFFDKVFSRLDDENLTPRLQTIFNIFHFLEDNEAFGFHNEANMSARDKFGRFLVLDDNLQPYNLTANDVNNIKLYDFMTEDTPFDFLEHTFTFLINTHGDRWEQYNFNYNTEEEILDRINDEVAGDGLVYHNTSLLVEHLRSSELRNAFNVESGFWNMVRDEQGDAMIRAILNVPQYEEHLFHSGLYKECIFNNWDSSVIVENEEFADYNNHFEELERRNLIVSMEYDEVIDLSRP